MLMSTLLWMLDTASQLDRAGDGRVMYREFHKTITTLWTC